jgi:hypothetical protein
MKEFKAAINGAGESISAESDCDTLHLENEYLKVTVLPLTGGKISELIYKKSGTQFFRESVDNINFIPKLSHGSDFLPPHAFGFDECFPNIAPGTFLHENVKIELQDHGEIWTQECTYEATENVIILYSKGIDLKYSFSKRIELIGNTVRIEYQLQSEESTPFKYIWSAHPLLQVDEGDEILLDDTVGDLVVNWASDPEIGSAGSIVTWPYIHNKQKNLSYLKVQNQEHNIAVKLYAHTLKNGFAGLFRHKTNETLMFSFDTNKMPYLGIWLCYGGWPEQSDDKEFTVALEPAKGGFDALEDAISHNKYSEINPGETQNWHIELSVHNGLTQP